MKPKSITPESFERDDVEVFDVRVAHDGYSRVDVYRLRHRKFDGSWSSVIEREVYQRGDACAVVLYDPEHDRVVMLEQFRAAAMIDGRDPWQIEIVAGVLGFGETPLTVAYRETLEETGYHITAFEPICDFLPDSGASADSVKLFWAKVDSSLGGGNYGLHIEDEDIRVFSVGLDEALAWVESGRIVSGTTILALHWLARNRERLRGRE